MEKIEEKKSFKILSQNMNIHHFVAHSYFARDERLDGLIKILPLFDIIALQEIFTFNLFGVGAYYREKIIQFWTDQGLHYAFSETAPWLQQGILKVF